MQTTSLQARLDIVSKKAENQRCCDCFEKQPGFASIIASLVGDPIGAFLCFQCSRVHHDLGNNHCYVLNICNPEEWAAEEVGALERGGNKVINAIFESKLAWDHPRPDSNSDMTAREKFCFEKYVNRKFYSSTAASKSLSKSKPISSRLFGIKAPKGKSSSRKIASFMSASSSSGDEFGDDDGLGYGDATPDSDTNGLGYGDAAPDSERQRPRQRRSRRRASISVPSEQQPQMDRDNARPDSEQPTPPHQGRRAGRRSSLGISSTPRSSGSNEAGRRKPGKRTPNGKSPSLGQSIDTSRSSENREKSPSRRGGNTSLNESQHSSTTSSARKNTRRRGSVSGNTSTLRVAKSTSKDNLDDGFVW